MNFSGAIVYYDGSHNDARMNISLAVTAARHGASIANHVMVTDLIKDENGKNIGAKMKDQLTGEEWMTKAKSIVNATGINYYDYRSYASIIIDNKKVNKQL